MRKNRVFFGRRNAYRGGPILAISTSRRSSISASTESSLSSPELSRSSAVADFSRCSVERAPTALDRAAAPLGRVVLALQRDQGVDAANGAERRRGLCRFRRLARVDRKAAGGDAARRGRVRNLSGGVRSVDAHDFDLSA